MLPANAISDFLRDFPFNSFSARAGRWVFILSSAKSSISEQESIKSKPRARGPKPKPSIDPAKPGQSIGLAHREKVLAGPEGEVSAEADVVLRKRRRGG